MALELSLALASPPADGGLAQPPPLAPPGKEQQVAGVGILLQISMLVLSFMLGHVLRRHRFYYLPEASASLLIELEHVHAVKLVKNIMNLRLASHVLTDFGEMFFLLQVIMFLLMSGFVAQPSPVPAPILQFAGSAYLLRATAWEHYGSAPMVRMNALVYATCFADAASSSELSLAYVKLIQQLAVFKGYSAAFSALKFAEKKFPSSTSLNIQLLRMQILHERALHWGHLKVAQQICDEFGVLPSSVSGVDIELKTEFSIRRAHTLLAAK